MMMIGESSAVVAAQVRKDERGFPTVLERRTISIAHIIEFSDLPHTQEEERKLRA